MHELTSYADLKGDEAIVRIGKHLVAEKDIPEPLKGREGYNFFVIDRETDEDKEYFVDGKVIDSRYHDAMRSLARYVYERLGGESPEEPERKFTDRVVFVAQPSADMDGAYRRLVKELELKGYTVMPDPRAALPTSFTEVTNIVEKALIQAKAAVHLLGGTPGFKPDGKDALEIVPFQLVRARERASAEPSFRRLVWAASVFEGAERDPIATLRGFDGEGLTDDQIVGDVSETKFVQFVLQSLDAVFAPRPEPPPPSTGVDRVYVNCRKEDRSLGYKAAKMLHDLGFNAVPPAFEGPLGSRTKLHKAELRDSDAVLFCWGETTDAWVRRGDTRDLLVAAPRARAGVPGTGAAGGAARPGCEARLPGQRRRLRAAGAHRD